MLLRQLLLAAVVTVPAAAQTASYTMYGSACARGAPPFAVNGVPRLGGSFAVVTRTGVLRGQVTNTDYVMIVNGTMPAALDLALLNSASTTGCGMLLNSAELVVLAPFTANDPLPYTLTIAVPNARSLLGATFYQQVVMASYFGFSFNWLITASRGGRGVIGR